MTGNGEVLVCEVVCVCVLNLSVADGHANVRVVLLSCGRSERATVGGEVDVLLLLTYSSSDPWPLRGPAAIRPRSGMNIEMMGTPFPTDPPSALET